MGINLEAGRRLRIGVLVSELEDKYVQSMIAGIETAAVEMDADVVIMPGRCLAMNSEDDRNGQHEYQHNTIYSYAAVNDFDVILVAVTTVALGLDDAAIRDFFKKFGDTPIIMMGGKVQGYPYVSFDNENGLYEGITQLIRQYGRKKIGFVAGPISNTNARERLLVYREVLMENGISFDPHKVVYGTFMDDCDQVVEELLDNNPDLDAIVFANDAMALSGYRVLKDRKIEIGSEMLVMGFDDSAFVLSMEPALTTVRADAVRMGYETVKQCVDLANGLKDNLIIDTRLIVRESFGKTDMEFPGLNTRLENVKPEHLLDSVLPGIYNTLFEGCYDRDTIERHTKLVKDYMEYIFGLIYNKPCNVIMYNVLEQKLSTWLRQEDEIPVHRKVRVLEYLHYIVGNSLPDETSKYHFAEVIKSVYRDIYFWTDQTIYDERSTAERINYVLTILTRDMLNFANGDERTYESMVDKIDDLFLKECYLYVYPDIHRHKENAPVKLPSHLRLRLYKNETEKGCPIGDTQDIGPDQLFENRFVNRSTRHTLIATMLFSAEEQYGVFVTALDSCNHKYVRTIARQFSSTVKTIFLLKQNAKLTAKLEDNLRQIKANNHVLSEISRRDELTGIYNRRGFMNAVEEELNDPFNRDKKAVMVYADMNNLKVINDKFGHEEGDFSLRLVASMLKESFRNTDIVGRFGGDEFAAFALVDQDNYVAKLRKRIESITEQANSKTDKPYYVSMSVGICEFLCEDGVSITDIMDTADGDLYSQKKSKRTEIMK